MVGIRIGAFGPPEPVETGRTKEMELDELPKALAEKYLEKYIKILDEFSLTISLDKTCQCDKNGTVWFFIYHTPKEPIKSDWPVNVDRLLESIMLASTDVPIAFMLFVGKEICKK